MAGNAMQFLRLPMLASSGLAVIASSLLYFKQKYVVTPSSLLIDRVYSSFDCVETFELTRPLLLVKLYIRELYRSMLVQTFRRHRPSAFQTMKTFRSRPLTASH